MNQTATKAKSETGMREPLTDAINFIFSSEVTVASFVPSHYTPIAEEPSNPPKPLGHFSSPKSNQISNGLHYHLHQHRLSTVQDQQFNVNGIQ